MSKDTSLIDKQTGEIVEKPYDTSQHQDYPREVLRQYNYIHSTIRDEKDRDKLSRLSPDTLSVVLLELTGMYESLSKWLADEKMHIADLKTSIEFKFADTYLQYKKRKSETNETARMQAKMACNEDYKKLDKVKHDYDVVHGWKKSIGRYHDAVRSVLSYEKSMTQMSRGQ